MSGASRTGVDVAIIKTDGETLISPIGFSHTPYTLAAREMIARACSLALRSEIRYKDPEIEGVESLITAIHVDAAKQLLRKHDLYSDQIDIVGYHGATIAHRPEKGWSWQIGNANIMSEEMRTSVCYNFRNADIAADGQGGPIAPIYHQSLFGHWAKPLALLDLGAIAKITIIDQRGQMTAQDIGIGTAMIDDWMLNRMAQAHDHEGALAGQGTVNELMLDDLRKHPFFTANEPLGIDRSTFSSAPVEFMSNLDGLATLTAFTAKTIFDFIMGLPDRPETIFVRGRGRHNKTLLNWIEQGAGVKLVPIDVPQHNIDALEAEAIAFLAVRSMRHLPITFPETTGCNTPTQGGQLIRHGL
jgi:anhydro-N-acetylmuramic acid kinase